MEGEVGERCGLAGIYLKNTFKDISLERLLECADSLITMGSSLQHRGQFSAGAATYMPLLDRSFGEVILNHRELGTIRRVFHLDNPEAYKKLLNKVRGIAGLFHTRYSTSGEQEDFEKAKLEIQPLPRDHQRAWKNFWFAFNGNIANHKELRAKLSGEDYIFKTNVDTEDFMSLFALEMKNEPSSNASGGRPDLFNVVKSVMGQVDGAYCAGLIFGDGDLLFFRDPHGLRPLVWGENEGFYAIASESVALQKIGINNFKDVAPGSAIIFDRYGVKQSPVLVEAKKCFCHFERIYFAKAPSSLDGAYVAEIRQRLGRELARADPLMKRISEEGNGSKQ